MEPRSIDMTDKLPDWWPEKPDISDDNEILDEIEKEV